MAGGAVDVSGLRRRLEALEAQAGPDVEGWPEWDFEDLGEGTASATVEGRISASDLPDGWREHVERMDPAKQPAHEHKLYEGHAEAKERRDYWRHFYSPEQVRAREEEQKRRDRELLERNRASVG